MNIEITWINRTKDADTTTIYRSSEPFGKDELPEPLAIIDGALESYLDKDLVPESIHYYRTKATRGEMEVISELMRMEALPYTGPGPQKLISGDMEQGYFGSMTVGEFISFPLLKSAIASMASFINSNRTPVWLKFAYKGKILYIPTEPLAIDIDWRTIYQAGLIYGVEGNGPEPVFGTPTDQMVTVRIQNQLFKIRTLKGDNNLLLGHFRSDADPLGLGDNEFTDLLVASNDVRGRIASPRPFKSLSNDYPRDGGHRFLDIVADRYGTAYCLCRAVGVWATSAIYYNSYAIKISITASHRQSIANAGNQGVLAWRPVLEWMPE